jgi:hypothetical protein
MRRARPRFLPQDAAVKPIRPDYLPYDNMPGVLSLVMRPAPETNLLRPIRRRRCGHGYLLAAPTPERILRAVPYGEFLGVPIYESFAEGGES